MLWPVLALILSLIAPGSGQILNGQFFKGFLFAFIFVFGRYVLLPLAIRVCKFADDAKSLRLIYIFNIIYPIIIILSAVDACYHAVHALHNAQMAIYAVMAAVIIATMYKGMGARFIVYAMSGREDLLPYILPRGKKK